MGTEVANMTVWKVLLSVFFGGREENEDKRAV